MAFMVSGGITSAVNSSSSHNFANRFPNTELTPRQFPFRPTPRPTTRNRSRWQNNPILLGVHISTWTIFQPACYNEAVFACPETFWKLQRVYSFLLVG